MSVGNIYAISDIHVDQTENMQWIEKIPPEKYSNDTLILAGDVTHILSKLFYTLKLLKSKFKQVFYCPGNHELWTKEQREDQALDIDDSIDKFHYILKECENIGIRTTPGTHGQDVTIVPLFGWYDDSLHMPSSKSESDLELWTDYHMCQWPQTISQQDIAKYFVQLNEKHLADVRRTNEHSTVITFSHFFTSKNLMEAYRDELIALREKQPKSQSQNTTGIVHANFSLVAGTELFNEQLQRLKPNVHIFGHSHRKMILKLNDGITYINNPLGYVRERQVGLIPSPAEFYRIDPHLSL